MAGSEGASPGLSVIARDNAWPLGREALRDFLDDSGLFSRRSTASKSTTAVPCAISTEARDSGPFSVTVREMISLRVCKELDIPWPGRGYNATLLLCKG